MNQIKQQITIQQATRQKVMHLLELTEVQYGSIVMFAAYDYLEAQTGDSSLTKTLQSNSLFWAWWRNHWHKTDMAFVTECERLVVADDGIRKRDLAEKMQLYDAMHNPETFEFTPHASILNEAFKTVKPLIKHIL
ncbi:hypothetical protein J3L18_29525 [Mucilaginibacter gossypii]|uniref:hypothetical protein n=1 Tax=Mucilaginibacter gossypii TaxID=551996 RepID=UPI000DCE6B70|nr:MULTISPECIES: hypothetical protein [Mucilaginibacter]QTE37198.1 hypothetical protein J3L18_29525 [Mucilaginibacter gossypii]RAV57161.1 hypothetical protein DIU36_12615 [Mucilaginibacter rubeus]